MRHALRSIRAVIAVLLLPLACTEPVRFGPAAKLAFVVQPSAAVHDAAFSPAIVVAIQDEEGRTVTSATNSVTLEIASNPSTGTLLGTTTVEAVKGVATFTGLTIDKPGFGYRLTASSAGLTSTSSNSFEIRPGPATKLGFIVQPTDVIHDQPINVLVAVQDDAGYTVTSVMALIHIKIGANSSTASLAGLDTARTSQGIASFSGLRISNLGADYTLVASSATALAQATSEPFDVTTGPAARLTFAMQPSPTGPGETIVPSVVVAVTDQD